MIGWPDYLTDAERLRLAAEIRAVGDAIDVGGENRGRSWPAHKGNGDAIGH
jgi:hypothetical protein